MDGLVTSLILGAFSQSGLSTAYYGCQSGLAVGNVQLEGKETYIEDGGSRVLFSSSPGGSLSKCCSHCGTTRPVTVNAGQKVRSFDINMDAGTPKYSFMEDAVSTRLLISWSSPSLQPQ
jgi:hypothetical protein